jgi:hypothetical protein
MSYNHSKGSTLTTKEAFMHIHFTEPTTPRYIYINPLTNEVHLLVPIVGGQEIGTDNTCKSTVALDGFFQQGAALRELNAYKAALEFDLQFLDGGHPLEAPKQQRLTQINAYIEAITAMHGMRSVDIITPLLQHPSNLYSIQLRPHEQDPQSHPINPIFSINRANDANGTPASALYNAMHAAYPRASTAPTPRERLGNAVLVALHQQPVDFNAIQGALTQQCHDVFGLDIDFTQTNRGIAVNKAYIDALMAFTPINSATQQDYIDALLGSCAPNLDVSIPAPASPFFSVQNDNKKAETLSMMTQFFLAHVNIHCVANGISQANFGKILDTSRDLSDEVVGRVISALGSGTSVEDSVCDFFNEHMSAFGLTKPLAVDGINLIKQTFERTYNTITATNENPHMDDFMMMDTTHAGKFVEHQGAICTNFAELVKRLPSDNEYFQGIRTAFQTEHEPVIPHKNEHIQASMDITVEELLSHLKDDEQFDKLPIKIRLKCTQSPAFQLHIFLHQVAKGKQAEAETLLTASLNKTQALLTTPGSFTDYSGRTFNCTAYEYAYWAKDTHMRRMLEAHMDCDTKAAMLTRIDAIEAADNPGLVYTQHSPEEIDSKHFSLESLKTAYNAYIQTYNAWADNDYNGGGDAVRVAWMNVGRAQRDLPVHFVNEYFRKDRSFAPLPTFDELTLPRELTFYNGSACRYESLFPLAATASSGLGVDFAALRGDAEAGVGRPWQRGGWAARLDLAAASHLDEVRTNDLMQSHQNLEPASPGLGMS